MGNTQRPRGEAEWSKWTVSSVFPINHDEAACTTSQVWVMEVI